MRTLSAITMLTVLVGCVVSPDKEGGVYEITDHTVTIRGAYSLDGTAAKPTPAMVEQAKGICPKATYLSATPFDEWTMLYLFRC
ncbi:hypothetical protein [Rhodovulum sp. MB263]|uniref:hypothetical protein n=1 Tax=Rhodovulum sp. (strain MB263) TaxID=308754 RepID=UPI0009B7655E|nr:hypothetical protein [Rhodovulum sp. MB263]ARC87143.1 hypothetical protein B5V46_00085 [Rhodovulum sp. MB263]